VDPTVEPFNSSAFLSTKLFFARRPYAYINLKYRRAKIVFPVPRTDKQKTQCSMLLRRGSQMCTQALIPGFPVRIRFMLVLSDERLPVFSM
jgi:hypothetical protein